MDYYLTTKTGEKIEKNPDEPVGVCGISHPCPFCGNRASDGRALNWIAGECIQIGVAAFPCNSCGQMVSIPSKIFVPEGFKTLKQKSIDRATGVVNARMLYVALSQMLLRDILLPNWGEGIESWNNGIRS
jgi:hypothetical protein